MKDISQAASILLVEDDSLLMEVLGEALRNHGLKVFEAATHEEALAVLLNNPDRQWLGVVTDHDMPHIDGLGLARAVYYRQFKVGKVIILSALDQMERELSISMEDLPILVLKKPFRAKELLRLLENK